MRRLCHYCKLLINRSLSYLYSIISQSRGNIQTCSTSKNLSLKTRTVTFQNSFFLNVICEWNKLDISICGSTSFLSFKNTILEKIRSSPNSIFGIHNPVGLKFLTKLKMSFSHLREHTLKHNLQDTLNPFCNCQLDVKTTVHLFKYCHNFMH